MTDRVIVGFRTDTIVDTATLQAEISALSDRVDLPLKAIDRLGGGLAVVRLAMPATASNVDAALSSLRRDPQVAFAEPDRRRYAHAIPNDPLYAGQWYLKAQQASAVRAETAWDSNTGSAGVIVAVLDTGIRYDHPDLERAASGGRLLPGYDFVSADSDGTFISANDGDGRDADASDPGDWVTTAEAALPIFDDNCDAQDESSWHGTRVAGLIGARSNNNTGIAGLTWRPWILPVRAPIFMALQAICIAIFAPNTGSTRSCCVMHKSAGSNHLIFGAWHPKDSPTITNGPAFRAIKKDTADQLLKCPAHLIAS